MERLRTCLSIEGWVHKNLACNIGQAADSQMIHHKQNVILSIYCSHAIDLVVDKLSYQNHLDLKPY